MVRNTELFYFSFFLGEFSRFHEFTFPLNEYKLTFRTSFFIRYGYIVVCILRPITHHGGFYNVNEMK